MKFAPFIFLAALSFQSFASELSVSDRLRAAYPNLTFDSVTESPIKGLYQVAMPGSKIIYFSPENNYLVFGEIYSHDGESLTSAAIAQMSDDQIRSIPIDKALVIGPEDGKPIIEFTDPFCPYCHDYDQFIQDKPGVKRIIFFTSAIHPETSPQVIEHIFCSDNPVDAFKSVYAGKTPKQLLTCDSGKSRQQEHDRIAEAQGVSSTPTLILGDKPLLGVNRDSILDYLSKQ